MWNSKYNHWYLSFGLLFFAFSIADTSYVVALVAYMLFVPLLDADWKQIKSGVFFRQYSMIAWSVSVLIIVVLIILDNQLLLFTLTTLAIAALPEEWFFRAYLQNKLGNSHRAIIISSIVFSCAHMITVSWLAGLLVFLPSIIYGYIYKKTGDLVLVILLHVLSNVLYNVYLHEIIDRITRSMLI